MLAPHNTAEFFAQHFEKLPLHVERNDPAYFADVYSIADVEDSLVVGAREPENFALVKAGSPEVSEDDFTYERPSVRWRLTGKGPRRWIDARKVISYFADGYTLIIKDAALFSARLQRFCNYLQRDLMAFAQPNVYFTPPSAQGFQVHHDTHDTLTAQVVGEKTWRIYEPIIQLPLESQPFHSGTKVEGLKLLDEVRLLAGDTLYIPRGFPHEAKTSDSVSLHCTFALAPVRVTDVMDLALRIAGDQDVELRHALPPPSSRKKIWQRDWASSSNRASRRRLKRRACKWRLTSRSTSSSASRARTPMVRSNRRSILLISSRTTRVRHRRRGAVHGAPAWRRHRAADRGQSRRVSADLPRSIRASPTWTHERRRDGPFAFAGTSRVAHQTVGPRRPRYHRVRSR